MVNEKTDAVMMSGSELWDCDPFTPVVANNGRALLFIDRVAGSNVA